MWPEGRGNRFPRNDGTKIDDCNLDINRHEHPEYQSLSWLEAPPRILLVFYIVYNDNLKYNAVGYLAK